MSSFETEHAAEKRRDQSAPAAVARALEPGAPRLRGREPGVLGARAPGRRDPARRPRASRRRGRDRPDPRRRAQPRRQRPGRTLGGKLGDSLDDVRVHTDDDRGRARHVGLGARVHDRQRRLLRARASTSPGSTDGDELLAHELAHVVQQRGAPTSGPLTVSQPGDALESEAEATAGDVVG